MNLRSVAGKLASSLLLFLFFTGSAFSQKQISLQGMWKFRLDQDKQFDAAVKLPGTTDQAQKGTKTSGPDYGILSRAYKYVGPAWYSREINVPAGWKGKDIQLFLERVMWESQVFVDDKAIGTQDALAVPHVHLLGKLTPGRHKLTLRINNDLIYNIGDKGHVYTEYTQSIWNGVVGKIELQVRENTRIENLQVYPDAKSKVVKLKLKVANAAPTNVNYAITDLQTGKNVFKKQLQLTNQQQQDQTLNLDFPIKLWDEFTPNRYRISATLQNSDAVSADFGFRNISHTSSKIMINDAPVFMRGNLDCVHFPLTGYPPCDVAEWERIFKIYKSYGLNHVRFHSWCPPEEAFEAADKLGIYIQAETIWIDWWMTSPPKDRPDMLTKGLPEGLGKNPSADKFVQAELQRILDAYGNHPSFTMLCIGNELGNSDFDVMQEWVRKLKNGDNRRLYSVSTARKIMPVDDFSVTHNIPGIGGTYGLQGAKTDYDLEKNYSRSTIPIIAHEVGQFPVYPLWSEINKYTGVLKARNLEQCRQSAISNGVLNRDVDFHNASGALQKVLYKGLIENFYRTPSCAGFEMLSMQDYQGQGEALVGWLDAFYDDKGTTSPEFFRQYNNHVVPLARFKSFVWDNTETFNAKLQVTNYGAKDLTNAVKWELVDGKKQILAQGTTAPVLIKRGEVKDIEEIKASLSKITQAQSLTLKVSLPGTAYSNEWSVWVYPTQLPAAAISSVTETNMLDDKTMDALEKGGTVLVYAAKLGKPEAFRPIFFSPLFWSNVFFPGQENTTLGSVIDAKHASLRDFPTDTHSDWQWESISRGRSFKLADWPAAMQPIIQPISDFHINEKLGSLLECRVGKGRLLICGYDIADSKSPVAKQLKYSLLKYASSSDFNPKVEVDTALLRKTFPFIKQAESKIPVPAEFENALLYIKAGSNVPKAGGQYNYRRNTDAAVLNRDTKYAAKGVEAVWRWDNNAAWFGKTMEIEINPPQGVIGELYIHFADWNNESRDAAIWLEGREFTTGKLDKSGKWVKLFVMREDTNDGKLILRVNSLAGSNAMIDELVLVEKK
ncbi:glycoside hydrolase family 2 TIM barrel-domain containing protein [Pedobacter frigoris]|uniref:glycoside hydrolase family 2 TIM barrel-domain containing protein n=1 Tax=Pedobacter frigoris TaxID=2571272 RepID=UPI00292ECCD8|nr:glycoside hydrolase family 2 TIM barrel-domain containing protein [Pedobacter frigoris]